MARQRPARATFGGATFCPKVVAAIVSAFCIVGAAGFGTAHADDSTAAPDEPGYGGQVHGVPGALAVAVGGVPNLHTVEHVQYPDVRGISQDEQGFIWFGVNHQIEGGLLRYDGYETLRYTHDFDDPTSLSHDQVSVTYVDREGVMWVGTVRGGLNRYNAETGTFTRYLHDPNDDTTLPNDDIESILQAADGTFWVGTETGLSRFDPGTGESTAYYHEPENPNSLPGHRVRAIVEDSETGDLWLGTEGGLSILDPDSMTFRNYAGGAAPTGLSGDEVEAIERDADGVWWVGTDTGLDRFDPETEEFARVPLEPASGPAPTIAALLEDSRGRLWVGGAHGLKLLDRERNELVDFVDKHTRDAVLGDASVQALFEDADGAIWIGTGTEGAARISPIPKGVGYHRHDPADPATINSDFVARVDATEDGLWLVTDESVEFFDGSTFTDHTEHFGLTGGWPEVHGVLAAGDDSIWLGFNDGSLAHVDVASGQMSMHEAPPPADDSGIWPVAQAANGDVWYRVGWGFGVGVLRANGESELLIGDEVDVDGPERAYAFNTAHLFDVDEQVLWVTGLGLTRIDVATGDVDVYFLDPDNPEAVVNQLWSVDQGPNGHLWLASSNGIHEFDPVTEQHLDLQVDSLPMTGATDARFGPDGRLWVVSGSSLTGLDTDSGDVITYSSADEAASNDRMKMENWVASKLEVGADAKMYAPTLEQGLLAFAPGDLTENPTAPPVVLTGFELFGQQVEPGRGVLSAPAPLTSEVRLSPGQTTFTFEFSALGYEHPERNRFRYRLDGFEEGWHYTTADRRFAAYTNVPPGDYVFLVEASNNTDVWSTEPLSVAVTVLTPWYETWWARLIAVLGTIAGLIALFRWRTRRQRQRTRELEERLAERVEHQHERDALLHRVQEQSERLEGILAAAPVGVVLLGVDHEVLLKNRVANDEFDSLATVDSSDGLTHFAGLSVGDLIGGDRTGTWATTTFAVRGRARTLSVTVRPIDPGTPGTPGTSGTTGTPVPEGPSPSSDETHGWVLLWDDITELEELQQQRARQDRLAAVGRFAAGIAHDVNNVLNVIGLNAELLNLDPDATDRSRTHAGHIVRETGNASKFITQILDFSRQSVSQPELLNAYAAVEAQLQRLGDTVHPDVQVEFHGTDPASIWADPVQLERILLNLIKNAQDAVGDRGTITVVVDHVWSAPGVDADRTTAWVRLAVSDDGVGIDPEVLPTIFEPFVTTKPVGKGTGLGLAQVAGIAAEHGGTVAVETAVGVGSTVSVVFPAANSAEVEICEPSKVPSIADRTTGSKAMVVESDVIPASVPARRGP